MWKALLFVDKIEQKMPNILQILDFCFFKLAKQGEEFDKKAKISTFFSQLPNLNKFIDEIFAFLYKLNFHKNCESLVI